MESAQTKHTIQIHHSDPRRYNILWNKPYKIKPKRYLDNRHRTNNYIHCDILQVSQYFIVIRQSKKLPKTDGSIEKWYTNVIRIDFLNLNFIFLTFNFLTIILSQWIELRCGGKGEVRKTSGGFIERCGRVITTVVVTFST